MKWGGRGMEGSCLTAPLPALPDGPVALVSACTALLGCLDSNVQRLVLLAHGALHSDGLCRPG